MKFWIGNLGDQLSEEKRQLIREHLSSLEAKLGSEYQATFYIIAELELDSQEEASFVAEKLGGEIFPIPATRGGNCKNKTLC
jgi:hypothetical protein